MSVYPVLDFTDSFCNGTHTFSWSTSIPDKGKFGQSFIVHDLTKPTSWPNGFREEARLNAKQYAKMLEATSQ